MMIDHRSLYIYTFVRGKGCGWKMCGRIFSFALRSAAGHYLWGLKREGRNGPKSYAVNVEIPVIISLRNFDP